MTTSLAQQLKKLAVPESSIYRQDKKRISLLFDPKEAASIDRETFYEIGLSGLEELKSVNNIFSKYESTLFSISSKDFERAIQSKDANKKVDKTIRKFLLHLSPYFLLQSSHKALEWLVNRYQIHKYNKDEIMRLILPYHETKIFVRCIQILKVEDATDRWNWLEPLQKPGISLAKSVLFNHCSSNPAMLEFISDMMMKAVKEFGDKAHLLTTLFAFYCSTIVGALEHAKVINESHISNILPGLLVSILSPLEDLRAAAYMITGQLISKAQLKKKIIEHIVDKLLLFNSSMTYEAILLLQLIYQTQDRFVPVSEKSISNLSPTNMKMICVNLNLVLDGGGDISRFLRALMIGVLALIQQNTENLKRFSKLPELIGSEIVLDAASAETIIKCAIDSYMVKVKSMETDDSNMIVIVSEEDEEDEEDNVAIQTWYSSFVKTLENKYPKEFDIVLKRELKRDKSLSEERRLALIGLLGFAPKLLKKLGDSFLFEKLYHQNSSMRVEAVKYLVSEFNNLKKTDESFLKESLVDRLNDEDPEVVMTILSLNVTHIADLITEELFIQLLKTILQRGLKEPTWWEPSCTALNYLCSFDHLDSDPTTCLSILPYLFPNSVEAIPAVRSIIKSPLGQAFLSGGDVSKVMTKNSPLLICQTIFKILENGSWLPSTDSLIKIMNSSLLEADYLSKLFTIILLSFSLQHKTSPQNSLDILNEVMKFIQKLNFTRTKEWNTLSDSTITEFIDTCNRNKFPVQCLTFFLERLLKATDLGNISNTWIDFTEIDFSRHFFIQMYEILIDGCSKKYEKAYSPLLFNLLNLFYPTSKLKMELITNFIYGERISNTSDRNDQTVVQVRSIRILHLLFLKTTEDISWVFRSDNIIFSILLCLNCEEWVVRSVALDIIEVVLQKTSGSDSYYCKFFEELLSRREEIELDHEQLPLILHSLLSLRNVKKCTQAIMKTTLASLIKAVVDVNTPYNIKSKITTLFCHVNSGDILSILAPVAFDKLEKLNENACIANVHYSQYVCNVFSRIDSTTIWVCKNNDIVWRLILNSMQQLSRTVSTADGSETYLCTIMMQQIDDELFSVLPIDKSQAIVSAIIDAGTFGMDSGIISAASKTMKRIELKPRHFTDNLTAMVSICDKSKAFLPKKLKTGAPSLQTLDTKEWKRGVTLLEYLQDKKKLADVDVLLPIYFQILKRCLEFEEQSPVEYTKQLLLTCILSCCQKLCPADNGKCEKIPKGILDIELIVMCIRGTQNPQTHNHALMLLAHAAYMLPDQVLHHIMAIFTFIGSSVLRHDDSYSFQIITRIVEMVVPILVKCGDINNTSEKELVELEKRVVPVLRIFVDVVLDVPEHRRLPLFKKLIVTLSSEHFLWTFLGLIFEGHVTHTSEDKVNINTHKKKIADVELPIKRVDFAKSFVLEFPPEVIMQSCIKLLTYLKTLPMDKQESDKDNDKHNATDPSAIFSISTHSAKHLRHFKYTCITFINGVLSSPILIQKIESISEKSSMEQLYKVFIVNILTYIQVVSKTADQNVGKPQAKYWKVMLYHSYEILDSVNTLLSVEMFSMVIRGLMAHNLSAVRRKAMEILNTKLQHHPTYFAECDKDIIYSLLHPLVSIISEINNDEILEGHTKPEMELNQQTALLSMKLIVRLFAADDPLKFKPVLEMITNLTKSHLTGNLMASVVLCLAELCSQLKAHAIAYLPKFMPALTKILRAQTKADTPEIVLLSVVTAVFKIIETIPLFLSPYLEKLLVEFSILSAKWEHADSVNNKNSSIVSKLVLIKNKISTTIAPRVLIPVIRQCYSLLLKKGKFDAIGPAMNILADSFIGVTSAEFTSLQQDLTTFFLLALQFRSDLTEEYEVSPRQIDTIEGHVIEALVALVLKLSESSFRPLYFKIFDWAVRTPNDDNRDRLITFYSLSSCMAENLKGLFVLFAGHFVKNAAEILDACNKTKTENLVFESEEKCCILIENILKTLHSVFLYDSQNFVNKDRFETLMQPLVDQLDNDIGGMEQLKVRAKTLISPCISQFAVATADDSLWKPLNYQILLKTRHNDADIRLLGIECMSEMATKLGDSWLPLLPESVPFLAELLEDEVPAVESATQKSVQTLEAVLGEPLQKYF